MSIASCPTTARPFSSSLIDFHTPIGSSERCCHSSAGIVPADLWAASDALNAPAATMSEYESRTPNTLP